VLRTWETVAMAFVNEVSRESQYSQLISAGQPRFQSCAQFDTGQQVFAPKSGI
jgi:hypothetical protein